MTFLPVVLAVLAGLSGGGVTWLVNRRKTSGTIRTSEADTIWDQTQNLLQRYEQQNTALRVDLETCQKDITILRRQMSELREEADQLREDSRRLRIDNALLRKQTSA